MTGDRTGLTSEEGAPHGSQTARGARARLVSCMQSLDVRSQRWPVHLVLPCMPVREHHRPALGQDLVDHRLGEAVQQRPASRAALPHLRL